jgi:hypothetical protein
MEYIPDFISAEEERELLKWIDASPWDTRLKRRTQHYGYIYEYGSKTLTPTQPIPDWCKGLMDKLPFTPTQLIVNE